MPGTPFGQLIRNAVAAEQAAAGFYRSLARSTKDGKAQVLLLEMAAQEDDHAARIEEAGRRFVADLPARANADVACVETAPAWAWSENLSLSQALDVAMEAEDHAWLYYDAVADALEGDARAFFRALAQTEQAHARQLRALGEALGKS